GTESTPKGTPGATYVYGRDQGSPLTVSTRPRPEADGRQFRQDGRKLLYSYQRGRADILSVKSDLIREKVHAAAYAEAYSVGLMALENSPNDQEIAAALHYLTAELRWVCMDLASRKIDYGREYCVLESLLREASKLTGQDLYGQKLVSPPSQ
ncbi:hypothetical protein, partial [Cupriavidus sp. YR651]|uniref:hypothetical protein n=1 Tax=Cupriavidus sp. YR651 TaxID=1855315 RepID=UPI001C40A241